MYKEALITQARVVGALILRETRVRYGRSQLGYLWAFTSPIMYVVAFTVMSQMIGSVPAYGDNMGLFVALGVVPYRLYQGIATQCGNAINANLALLNFPIVKELDPILARGILEAATFVIILAFIITGLILATDAPMPYDLYEIGEGFIGLCLFGFGVGTINAVIGTKFPSWMNFYGLLSMPLFWLSGIFYSLESLPAAFREILIWNPVIHELKQFVWAIFRIIGIAI